MYIPKLKEDNLHINLCDYQENIIFGRTMLYIVHVLYMDCILDSCSFQYAHTLSKSCISICWRHLVTSKQSSNPIFFFRKDLFHFIRAQCSEIPSYIITTQKTVVFLSQRLMQQLLQNKEYKGNVADPGQDLYISLLSWSESDPKS